ncbi:hypothetical protein BCR32DRAFT_279242 [Anaeromyces robustus]|uniref:Uncharacterized protein n=1 Tax=Anaeromyces robustus TaxID=1754192 RepID=A0A1Y1X8C3_9FUNG|nr:hypothetical protein BCR32DRAFT_279242 [Anaeromyces robustus]|eukprot:ORX82003.1 hypothetical protein BCR32DRAFT_279242 [Anaeromyces robustus]
MGALKNMKKIFSTPYKAIENRFIPIVNSLNNYLDRWFPQDKWNWRKIAVIWAILQVIVVGTLEVWIAYNYKQQVNSVCKHVESNGKPDEILRYSTADPLSVYHVIFVVALFYQFYLICDTISKSSTLQLIAVTLFSFALAAYSIVQRTQANNGNYYNFFDENKSSTSNDQKNLSPRPKKFEIAIIILSFLFSFGWIIISLRLYKVFGWNVFKQLGADIDVKNRLKLYHIFLTLLKIDFFFFIAFAMQFLVFTVAFIKNNPVVKIINLCLIVLVFIMPFFGFGATKKENYRLMSMFLLMLSVSIGYMTYSTVDIIVDMINGVKDENTGFCETCRYRNCQNSLLVACIFSMIISFVTFGLALVNFKNFPKGLKKDKSIRMYNNFFI